MTDRQRQQQAPDSPGEAARRLLSRTEVYMAQGDVTFERLVAMAQVYAILEVADALWLVTALLQHKEE